ncbi:hypothetical protein [Streptomyces sp. DH12]|uniref:hypothetical protein n=1 Tax=Streptomyces sp. DH12 TaxID=2857010 RepID=UPI001E3A2185|nr:hypothetical protein [Streptomyces sp. DH12]
MYLVHAQFAPPPAGGPPRGAMLLARTAVLRDPRVQHVAVHPEAPSGPVLGVFVMAGSVEQAEDRVTALCRGVLRNCPDLSGWRLVRCEIVLGVPGAFPSLAQER